MFGNNFNRPVHLEDCGRLFFDCVLQGGDQLLQLGCSCLLGSETLLDFTFEPLKHILVVLVDTNGASTCHCQADHLEKRQETDIEHYGGQGGLHFSIGSPPLLTSN